VLGSESVRRVLLGGPPVGAVTGLPFRDLGEAVEASKGTADAAIIWGLSEEGKCVCDDAKRVNSCGESKGLESGGGKGSICNKSPGCS